MIELIKYFLLNIVLFAIVFIIGKLIVNSLEKQTKDYNLFHFLLVGLISIVLCYSIIKSKFISIHIILIPLIILYVSINKIKFRFYWTRINWKSEILPFIFLLSVIYFIQFNLYFDIFSNEYKRIFLDNYTYSSIVSNLNSFGVENSDYSLSFNIPTFRHQVMPYRYSDLWIASFVSYLFKTSAISSYILISSSFVLTLVVYLIYSQLLTKNHKVLQSTITAFILSFSSILFIFYLNPVEELKYLSETSFIGVFKQKTALATLFFLLGLFNFNNFKKAFFCFIVIPILYVSYLPSIWGGLFLYLLINIIYRFKKREKIKEEIMFIFVLIFTIVCYFIFYNLFGEIFTNSYSSKFSDIPIFRRLPKEIKNLTNLNSVKSFLGSFIGIYVPSVLNYLFGMLKNIIIGMIFFLPFILFYFDKFSLHKKKSVFLFLIMFNGLIFLIIRDRTLDNEQFFTNTLVFLSIFFSFLYVQHEKEFSNKLKIFYLLTLLICCVIPIIKFQSDTSTSNKYEQNFVRKVNYICHKTKTKTILIYANKSSFNYCYYNSIDKNILFPLTQHNLDVNFSIANSEDYKNINNWKNEYHFNFNLISNIKKLNPSLDIKQIFKKFKFKSFLFYPNVKIPNFISENPKKTLIKNKYGYKFVHIYNF